MKTTLAMDDDLYFLTPAEVMAMLRYTSPSAFWVFVHGSGMPHVCLNRRVVRFERRAVLDFLNRRSSGETE
jgi:hypothetical protein